MPFFENPQLVKILLFFLGAGVVIAFINHFPDLLVSRFLLSWNGPAPRNNESLARFTFRNALYALRWFTVFVTIFFVIGLTFGGPDGTGDSPYLLLAFFALMFFTGMSALATVLLLCKAVFVRLRSPYRRFRVKGPDENGWFSAEIYDTRQ